ncbi:acid phosphatase 1-like [Andrographis paniculata]|uniref:acid phosphatase 1-like n=1 Tax=Andrographis paniculata TaxID=175694 RepID=UPI0021E719C5|nr:acid phosphatase 1-like [Andrographis paniculata]
MASIRNRWGVIALVIILAVEPISSSLSPIIQIKPGKKYRLFGDGGRRGPDLYCESWWFTVETNDAGSWTQVPERCVDFVKEYVTGPRYLSDSDAVAENAVAYAREVEVSGREKDAWVFDVDETLLSNVPYYAAHGYGSELFDEPSFDKWVDLAIAPALPASLRLYRELQELGFTIFLLTGRSEFQRNSTELNLRNAGFNNWKQLILRGDEDQGKPAPEYKSEKRKEIEQKEYVIRGNSGDQWSDLRGFAVARRSFKLPNPMYFIP